MIQGGCFCTQTRYTIKNGDYRVVNCHCTMCRRNSAAPTKILRFSENGTRRFCSNCGTHLTFTSTDRPDELNVTVGSLDNPQDFPPSKAVCEATKLPWLNETE
jgi:hypothetical protein